MPTIEIYLKCEKPDWMKVGAWCYCYGEAYDKFKVVMVLKNAAVLNTWGGKAHGTESFAKLHRNKPQED